MIGAGKSATVAIDYFLSNASQNKWHLILADADKEAVEKKLNKHPNATAKKIDINNAASRKKLIASCDLVVSMLPPAFHVSIIKDCIALKKDFINASYATPEILALQAEAKKAGVRILCEMGLDPGIDHLSALKTIHEIQQKGGKISSFKSYCGGLIAPESDTNPWHYKFTWNPRNVILAGQATAQYLDEGKVKYLPYNRLFSQTAKITIDSIGALDGYANRDSLSYIPLYGLQDATTFLRGTLRYDGFCEAWDVLIQIGLTDDSYKIANSSSLTYKQWLMSYFEGSTNTKNKHLPLLNEVAAYLNGKKSNSSLIQKLQSIGLFSEEIIGLPNASPAQILQQLLEKAWKMEPDDKDLIVMQHQFTYVLRKQTYHLTATLVCKGDNQLHTAMAKTVGLPLAIGAKLLLKNKVKAKGIVMPLTNDIYEPVLLELQQFGIVFKEVRTRLN
jgi:saccharopine dehydrogenase-like NADP-dependent oxidoreductase